MEEREIAYEVVYVSSSEGTQDLGQITEHLEDRVGWISSKNCFYPQQIILELRASSHIRKLQLLCHNKFIPESVDFYVAKAEKRDADPRDLNFEKIGYVELGGSNLDSETEGDDEVYEQKTVFVKGLVADFIKLKIRQSIKSRDNPHSQVGIKQLRTLGTKASKEALPPDPVQPQFRPRPPPVPQLEFIETAPPGLLRYETHPAPETKRRSTRRRKYSSEASSPSPRRRSRRRRSRDKRRVSTTEEDESESSPERRKRNKKKKTKKKSQEKKKSPKARPPTAPPTPELKHAEIATEPPIVNHRLMQPIDAEPPIDAEIATEPPIVEAVEEKKVEEEKVEMPELTDLLNLHTLVSDPFYDCWGKEVLASV